MSSGSTGVKESQNSYSVFSRRGVPAPANGKKRPSEEGEGRRTRPHGYKPKKRKTTAPPKNALTRLNELRPGLPYRLESRSGPVHAPLFVMSVEVDGRMFRGSGPNKKSAKQDAAETALRSFIQLRTPTSDFTSNRVDFTSSRVDFTSNRADFTSSRVDFTLDWVDFSHALFNASETSVPPDNPSHGSVRAAGSELSAPIPRKNPIMTLNELRPGLQYRLLSESGRSHAKNFVVSLVVEGRTFRGSGRNKRLAKARAAQAALTALFHLQPDLEPSRQPVPREGPQLHLPQVLADTVSRLVVDKFGELTDNFTSPHARRKVLAGVVMTTGPDVRQAQVICVSTGSKCISSDHLSRRGLALNDCHAEVVARRSVVRFLYSQLEVFLCDDEDEHQRSVFMRSEDGRGFRLRDGVQFHLYVSASPCGDARIFSPHEVAVDGAHGGDDQAHRPPARKTRGLLRTKIQSGEGTVPVPVASGSSGVVQGEKLLTMSCSDKLARWNVLGFQGSLLTFFTRPIYFSSVILGSLYHADHLSRAVYRRLSGVELPSGSFVLNRPLLSGISDVEARQPGKAPDFSVNWAVGDPGLEVVDATTGRDELGPPSRLCKHQLYSRWRRLHCRLSSLLRIRTGTPGSYYQAKQCAVEYHSAKQAVFLAFLRSGLGSWLKKPPEQEQFGTWSP
ncbi:double-stranded RNA-specific editase 1-like [Salarias fasciatus]|uniref:double-stranded RNA-specific editase 1-like n=1 Tax=Salarias fasciatus TaxID=181472 RepID=UPI001176BBAC|nr:double-stranded RNA-specific editase 1-like [Salarias fasciatus]